MTPDDPFLEGEDWYLDHWKPTVTHYVWGLDYCGPTYESYNTFTKPSGWRSYVVLPKPETQNNTEQG
jgi:hypothetical protein